MSTPDHATEAAVGALRDALIEPLVDAIRETLEEATEGAFNEPAARVEEQAERVGIEATAIHQAASEMRDHLRTFSDEAQANLRAAMIEPTALFRAEVGQRLADWTEPVSGALARLEEQARSGQEARNAIMHAVETAAQVADVQTAQLDELKLAADQAAEAQSRLERTAASADARASEVGEILDGLVATVGESATALVSARERREALHQAATDAQAALSAKVDSGAQHLAGEIRASAVRMEAQLHESKELCEQGLREHGEAAAHLVAISAALGEVREQAGVEAAAIRVLIQQYGPLLKDAVVAHNVAETLLRSVLSELGEAKEAAGGARADAEATRSAMAAGLLQIAEARTDDTASLGESTVAILSRLTTVDETLKLIEERATEHIEAVSASLAQWSDDNRAGVDAAARKHRVLTILAAAQLAATAVLVAVLVSLFVIRRLS